MLVNIEVKKKKKQQERNPSKADWLSYISSRYQQVRYQMEGDGRSACGTGQTQEAEVDRQRLLCFMAECGGDPFRPLKVPRELPRSGLMWAVVTCVAWSNDKTAGIYKLKAYQIVQMKTTLANN